MKKSFEKKIKFLVRFFNKFFASDFFFFKFSFPTFGATCHASSLTCQLIPLEKTRFQKQISEYS